MPTIDEIYRANLRLLAKEAGSQDKLAERIKKSPAQVSQWINASKDSKTDKPRALSRQVARQIEKAFPKDEGWMDQSHAEVPSNSTDAAEQAELMAIYKLLPTPDAKLAVLTTARAVLHALPPPGRTPLPPQTRVEGQQQAQPTRKRK